MSDRLNDLQHQRDLVREQLAWLEREIARESGQPAAPFVAAATSRPTTITPAKPFAAAQTAPEAETILAQYQSDPSSLHKNVKLGCYLYFAAALVLLVLGLTAFYFLHLPHH